MQINIPMTKHSRHPLIFLLRTILTNSSIIRSGVPANSSPISGVIFPRDQHTLHSPIRVGWLFTRLCSSLPAVRLSLPFLCCPAAKCGWRGPDLLPPLLTLLLLEHVATTTTTTVATAPRGSNTFELVVSLSSLVARRRSTPSFVFASLGSPNL